VFNNYRKKGRKREMNEWGEGGVSKRGQEGEKDGKKYRSSERERNEGTQGARERDCLQGIF
jgi:hypothetical protein